MSLPLIQPMTGGGGVSATSNSTPSLPITSNAGNYLASFSRVYSNASHHRVIIRQTKKLLQTNRPGIDTFVSMFR